MESSFIIERSNGTDYDYNNNNNNNSVSQTEFCKNGSTEKQCFDNFQGKPLVVYLDGIRFDYSKKEKLINNLNVHVAQGHIYGLLGPSGCGKSTTLKIILGLIRPQKGNVLVFGTKPYTSQCQVPGVAAGYMPQDLALMPTLTVSDNFNYYGKLCGMSDREIGKRSAYLVDLLQIPSMERPIARLSGGQQRRISLALALLHQPPLLILDEPTVGIDPLLRNKIWAYLEELTIKESKTIIITTHYIEEARNAHMIGLMRYGRLLAEANPDRLLKQFQMSTIEDVFLNLCEKEDASGENAPKESNKKSLKKSTTRSITNKEQMMFARYENGKNTQNFYFDNGRVRSITADAFNYMGGKFWTIFVACLLPTVQIFLFHFAIGKPPQTLQIVVNNADNRTGRFSNLLVDNLQSSAIDIEHVTSKLDAIDRVENGYAYASFEFQSNFTRCLMNRMRKGAHASDYDIDCSRIKMISDNTYQFIIFQLALKLRDAFLDSIYAFFPRLGYNPETLNIPVKMEEFVYGNDVFSYQEFMTPGMYMALIYLAPLIVTLFVFLEQKVYGHVQRTQACGAKPLEILTAHVLANMVMLVIQTGAMMGTSLIYFEAQNFGSLALLLAIVFMEGMAGVALAILMASILNDKLMALVFIYGLTVSLWFICGVFWPIQNITMMWAQKAVLFLPLTLPIESARNIMNRGWDFYHIDVMMGFGSATAFFAIPLLLAYMMFK